MSKRLQNFVCRYVGVLILFTVVINMIMYIKIIPNTGVKSYIPSKHGNFTLNKKSSLREHSDMADSFLKKSRMKFDVAVEQQTEENVRNRGSADIHERLQNVHSMKRNRKLNETVAEPDLVTDKKNNLNMNRHKAVGRQDETVVEPDLVTDKKNNLNMNRHKAVGRQDETVVEPDLASDKNNNLNVNRLKVVGRQDETVVEPDLVTDKNNNLNVNRHKVVGRQDGTVVESDLVTDKNNNLNVNRHKVVGRQDETVAEPDLVTDKKNNLNVNRHKIVGRQDALPPIWQQKLWKLPTPRSQYLKTYKMYDIDEEETPAKNLNALNNNREVDMIHANAESPQNNPAGLQDPEPMKVREEHWQGFNADYIRNFQKKSKRLNSNEMESEKFNNYPSTQRHRGRNQNRIVDNTKTTRKIMDLGADKENTKKKEVVTLFKELQHLADIPNEPFNIQSKSQKMNGKFELGGNSIETQINYKEPSSIQDKQNANLQNPSVADKPYETRRQLKSEKERSTIVPKLPQEQDKVEKTASLMTVFPPRGKLGNQIFQFASMLGIANSGNFTPFLENEKFLLSDIFDLPRGIYLQMNTSSFAHFTDDNDTTGDSISLSRKLDRHMSWQLDGYFQSYKYFWHIQETVRSYLKFKGLYAGAAERFINRTVPPGHVKVAIHVRRTDFTNQYQRKLGRLPAPREYIERAMQHFRVQYSNITFLVVSDDTKWCQDNIQSPDVRYSTAHHPGVDLAIMSQCDHVIITVGTFGWWGGWLAAGTVVYYKNYPRPGSDLDQTFNTENYYPKDWIGLE